MTISLENVGKRFNRQWIFRSLHTTIATGSGFAILGANGSGKSTLLKTISGWIMPSEGRVEYLTPEGKILPMEHIPQYLSMAAPYLELIEEFTFRELIHFQAALKPHLKGITSRDVIEISGLALSVDKPLRHFSSGMKQRARLCLALLTDTPLVLLDEPCSNLDAQATAWYRELIDRFGGGRTIIVCSNHQETEYDFCREQIRMEDYKS
jgi:ABC-type multidrug transport system ATPase subunit